MNLKKLEIQKKDLLYIVLSVIILVAVFILGYNQLNSSGGASAGVTVEVVQPVGSSFNTTTLDHLRDEAKSKNFVVPVDLGTGVGTTTPFGQL
jgi:hypothetical protein